MARLILDSGAVIALSRGDRRASAFIEKAIRRGDLVFVPAVVVAETTRGGPADAPVNRILKAVDAITVVTEDAARLAGRLLRASRLSNATVDALIAAEAVLSIPATIVTGDLDDMSQLVSGHPAVHVYHV